MKRLIPILILLAAVIAAGVHYYPRLFKKPAADNQLTLSGNIEAHESLVSFKVRAASSICRSKKASRCSKGHCWPALKMPISTEGSHR